MIATPNDFFHGRGLFEPCVEPTFFPFLSRRALLLAR